MKKSFEMPRLEIITVADVIMTSGTGTYGDTNGNDNEGGY